MTTITDKKQYPSEQYLNELITNIEFAARAPVEVVRAMAAELQKRREADSAEPASQAYKLNALDGNSPVTPDGWVMVPKQVTPEISNAINVVGQRCTCGNCSQRLWDLLLDATQQGVNRG
ncbi:TPA: hypothetical protein ACNTAS_000981 [Escherichia coli]